MDEAIVTAVLDDWRTAPVRPALRAILEFLEQITLHPEESEAAHIAPLKAARLSDQQIEEALGVCFIFNIIDRLADAFDFHLPSQRVRRDSGQLLYNVGYRIGSIPG